MFQTKCFSVSIKGGSSSPSIFQNVRPPAERSREDGLQLQGLLSLNQEAVAPPWVPSHSPSPPPHRPRACTPAPLTTGNSALVGGALLRFGVKEEPEIPPRHAHGDLTSLAPHERLPDRNCICLFFIVVLRKRWLLGVDAISRQLITGCVPGCLACSQRSALPYPLSGAVTHPQYCLQRHWFQLPPVMTFPCQVPGLSCFPLPRAAILILSILLPSDIYFPTLLFLLKRLRCNGLWAYLCAPLS